MQATLKQGREMRVTAEHFASCYRLLRESFASVELDSESSILADLVGQTELKRASQYLMLARTGSPDDSDSVISLIAGCYLRLDTAEFDGQGIGFIEYLVTRRAFRQHGYAGSLLSRFEYEMQQIAASRGERLRLILGEVEPELMPFKRKRGYRWPMGSHYAQPPVAFDPLTGVPLTAEVPKRIMVQSWGMPIHSRLLSSAVEVVFRERYLPRDFERQAALNAETYIMERIYAPFVASLVSEGDHIVLT